MLAMNGMGTAEALEPFERDRGEIGSRSIERVSPAWALFAIISSSLCLWGAILFLAYDAAPVAGRVASAVGRFLP